MTTDHRHLHHHPVSPLGGADPLVSSSPISSSSGRTTIRRGSKLTGLLMKTASPPPSPSGKRTMQGIRGSGASPRGSLYAASYNNHSAIATSSPRQKRKSMYRRKLEEEMMDVSSSSAGSRRNSFSRGSRPPVMMYTVVFLVAFTLGNFWNSVFNHLQQDGTQGSSSGQYSPLSAWSDSVGELQQQQTVWDTWADSWAESAERAQAITNIPKEDDFQPSTLEFLNQTRNWTEAQLPPSNTTVIFMVMSARHNFDRRQTIRETWRQGHESNVYFLVSDICWVLPQYKYPDPYACEGPQGHNGTFEQANIDDQQQLEQEQQEHRDLIFVPRKESYRSLVYKLKFAYKWSTDHVPKLKWVVKVDDDMVVRVQSMEFFLQEHEPIQKPSVVGNIIYDSEVARDGKWKELPSYLQYTYPPWPQGSFGHVVSYHVARFVAAQIDDLVEYQGEDTSLGIWINENKTMKESVRFMKTSRFHNEGNCHDASFLIVGHEVSIDRMRSCYEQMDEVITHEVNIVRTMLNLAQEKAANLTWVEAKPATNNDGVVVIVTSERSNFLARQTIRDTWAATSNSSVFFFMGSECDIPHYSRKNEKCIRDEDASRWSSDDESYVHGNNKTANGILYEQSLYRDLYVSDLPEAHKEAEAYGMKAAYKWIVERAAPKARWIVRASDQMYVRLRALEEMLATNFSSIDGDQPIIIGEIVNRSEVWKEGPWADPDYAADFYPPWPKGSCGQVVSRPVASFVAQHFDKLYHYQGSDTSLAIWLDDFNVTVDFRNDMNGFKNDNDCFQQEALMVGYELMADKLRECFDNDVSTGTTVAPNKSAEQFVLFNDDIM